MYIYIYVCYKCAIVGYVVIVFTYHRWLLTFLIMRWLDPTTSMNYVFL